MRNNRHLNKSSVVDNHKSPLSVTLSPASTMGTRQRRNLNSSGLMATQQRQDGTPERRRVNNTSVIGGTGPLLSSPFMPQIKRALGLEPNLQHKYGEQRRHSYSLNISSPTVTSPSLPHVKLNRTRRLSLTERNTSMMNRSSTVKIAPPVMGKVASPSLYHLRCNTATMENRGTPDTYAVISALKDRRKRSVNVMEETMDSSTQQAKRRRQESQHSNASTSSMPSMPDHFPELTGADFSMRLETPGIKRPSRPSQADDEDWQHSEETKRQKCLNKNNSILSSLSSSQRFIQNQKRRADSSFTEKENTSGYETKLPRGEPPRLTHLDVSYDTPSRTISVPVSTACTEAVVSESLPSVSKVTEGQTHKSQDSNISVPAVTKLPSMKKTASIYSGLGSPASFKKKKLVGNNETFYNKATSASEKEPLLVVQYANVVATLDDYDSDREVEQQRVKQMLKDLDESFNTKQAKTEETKKTETVLTTSTMVTSVTTSVTIATTAALSTTSTTSVLSALEKLSKSPVQETGAPGVMSILGAASTQPSVTVKAGLGHSGGALLAGTFGASGAGSILSTVSSTQPVASAAVPSGVVGSGTSGAVLSGVVGSGTSAVGGFTFNTSKQAQSLSGLLASATSSSVTVSSSGMTGPSGAGQNVGAGGFNFGSVASTPATSTTAATGFAAPVVSSSTAAPVGGFNFATTGAAVSSSTGAPGFSFGASSTPLTSQGVLFGAALSTTPSSSGFNVPSSTPAPTGSSTGGFSFGLSAGASTVSSQPAPQTSSLSGFSFGAGTNTGIGANSNTSSGMNPPPYTMNTAASTASQITSATGSTAAPFNFGSQSSSAAASTFSFGAGATTTASTAAGAGLFQMGTVSTTTFGAKTTEQSSMFGAPAFGSSNTSAAVSANPTSAFGLANQTPAFGSANQTPAFGVSNTSAAVSANPTPTFGAANQPPAFGAANQTPAFGSTNQAQPFGTTNPAPTFGSANPRPAFGSANQTPAFGSTNQAPAFGAANPTAAFGSANQAPAFGTTNPAPAFGSASQPPAFGSVNQPPAFGTANPAQGFGSANPTPAFGSANPTPAFGSTNQAPAFGSTNQAPSFGSTGQAFGAAISQKSNTPVFGSTSNSSSGSTFGAPTGFAKSQSMPVFATTNNDNSNNASTFNFGAPAPNVNPFGQGQKTPAKQTGSAFGQITTDGTPKAQTGALYQFGQSNNNSTVAKGFDFSSSTGGASGNTGGYNFMASSSVPVFNFGATDTPTATPNFGTPGATPGFSVGAGETAQRATRPRVRGRRTARK